MGDDVVADECAATGLGVADLHGPATRAAADVAAAQKDVAADAAAHAAGGDGRAVDIAKGHADGVVEEQIVFDDAAGAGLEAVAGGVGDDVAAHRSHDAPNG